MENRRSKGITIFAWIIIVLSVINLISRLDYIFKGTLKDYTAGIGDYFYLIISILAIIAAIFLLKLKEWARIATLIVAALVIINIILVSLSTIFKNFLVSLPASLIMLVITLIPLAFEGGVIYYFTRPVIKEQFK
ncbi:MAG: hypothetical protein FJZ09_06590 [Candidatus Omnitrophica bacterium]|nr:hypothetical protein [Candidatus Omnitrophota bacterium]